MIGPTILGRSVLGRSVLGTGPAPTAPAPPVVARDLDLDLVAFLGPVLSVRPAPLVVLPGPQQTLTACYTLVSEVATNRLSGPSGLATRVYQVDLRSTDPVVALAAAESIRRAIQGYRGPMGTTTVRGAGYRRLPTIFDQAANRSPSGTFRVACELTIRFVQPVPAS